MNQQDYTRLCVIVGKQPQLSPYVKSYNSAKANHQPHQWIIVDPQTATAFNIVCQLWSRGIDVDSKDSLGPPYDEIFREVIKREMSVGQHYGPDPRRTASYSRSTATLISRRRGYCKSPTLSFDR